MKKEQFKEAKPIIDELRLLDNLVLPNAQSTNRGTIEIIYPNETNIEICFKFAGANQDRPIIKGAFGSIMLQEFEYNEIKKVINRIVDNRIKIQNTNLERI